MNIEGTMEEVGFDAEKLKSMVAPHLQDGVARRIHHGGAVGNFLRAVFANDLFSALVHADENSERNLPSLCKFLYNYSIAGCYGSAELAKDWQDNFGFVGWESSARVDARIRQLLADVGREASTDEVRVVERRVRELVRKNLGQKITATITVLDADEVNQIARTVYAVMTKRRA